MALRPPKITWDSSGKCYVVFYLNGKRYRLSNGSRMGINLNPNRHEVGERKALAEELRLKIHLKLIEGWKDGKIDSQDKLITALDTFRHTGAIEVYKKTKDIAVVQQVMGHASMQVTMGYLRNLEVPVLRIEDMPNLHCELF